MKQLVFWHKFETKLFKGEITILGIITLLQFSENSTTIKDNTDLLKYYSPEIKKTLPPIKLNTYCIS